jgi:hypothetical protein
MRSAPASSSTPIVAGFVVVITKPSGTRVEFSSHPDERSAWRVANRLREVGCAADVARAVAAEHES